MESLRHPRSSSPSRRHSERATHLGRLGERIRRIQLSPLDVAEHNRRVLLHLADVGRRAVAVLQEARHCPSRAGSYCRRHPTRCSWLAPYPATMLRPCPSYCQAFDVALGAGLGAVFLIDEVDAWCTGPGSNWHGDNLAALNIQAAYFLEVACSVCGELRHNSERRDGVDLECATLAVESLVAVRVSVVAATILIADPVKLALGPSALVETRFVADVRRGLS